MPLSDARKNANKKWNDANLKERYDRVQLVIPKGQKEVLQDAARQNGESVNAFVWRLIQEELHRLSCTSAGGNGKSDSGGDR